MPTASPSGIRRLLPVLVFTAAYLLPATALSLRAGNAEFLFYVVVMLLLITLVAGVDRRVSKLKQPLAGAGVSSPGLPTGLLWALSIWGLMHMAGGLLPIPADWPRLGEAPVLYNLWLISGFLKYDQLTHAYGFGLTTVICWSILRIVLEVRDPAPDHPPKPTGGLLLLCAAAGMGFGALNEVVEFAATKLVPDTNVGGYDNTGWDLVSNLVGVTVAALGIRFMGRPRDKKPLKNDS